MSEMPVYHDPDDDDPEQPEEILTGASVTEMTGLIPSGRPDKERESYQDVLPWLPPFAPQI